MVVISFPNLGRSNQDGRSPAFLINSAHPGADPQGRRIPPKVPVSCVKGDLLDQPVDVIVNAWNRNILPWWLLLPQGVSGAIKKRGGTRPFKELSKMGPIPLGDARLTGPGELPFKAIIHVAGINGWWRASEYSIRHSVRNALRLAQSEGFESIAFPLIGGHSGGFNPQRSKSLILEELESADEQMNILVVEFEPSN